MAKTTLLLTLFVVLAVGFGLLAGCSSRPETGEETSAAIDNLRGVNDLLHSAAGATGRVPAHVADLSRYQKMSPRGYEAVKSGDIVVLWGAAVKGEEDVGKDETVLAYEKDVPTEGGYVLLSAGTVTKMTVAEFQAAPKSRP